MNGQKLIKTNEPRQKIANFKYHLCSSIGHHHVCGSSKEDERNIFQSYEQYTPELMPAGKFIEIAVDLLELAGEVLPGKIFLWVLVLCVIGGLIYWIWL